jgi:hypothetical protein
MRRALSILLFLLGGWVLASEILTAFMDVQPGVRDSVIFIALFGALAAVPLLLGAWATPGRSWRELGLTVLLGAGFGAIAVAAIAAMMVNPEAAPLLPQMRGLKLAPAIGIANLLFVCAVGIALYRTGKPRTAPEASSTVSPSV